MPGGVALSVGVLLPILISADIAAVLIYRRHTEWKFIFRLLPFFLIGILAGWLVFDYFKSRDELLKTLIGAVLLGMTALHFLRQWTKSTDKEDKSRANEPKGSLILGIFFGLLGGIATMLANAAGPVAQLYLWPWPFLNMPLLELQLGYSLL